MYPQCISIPTLHHNVPTVHHIYPQYIIMYDPRHIIMYTHNVIHRRVLTLSVCCVGRSSTVRCGVSVRSLCAVTWPTPPPTSRCSSVYCTARGPRQAPSPRHPARRPRRRAAPRGARGPRGRSASRRRNLQGRHRSLISQCRLTKGTS